MKKIITYQSKDGNTYENKKRCIEQDRRLKDGGIFMSIIGEISESDLFFWLGKGFSLQCYEPGRLSIFGPQGCGGQGMIYGEIADRLGAEHDPHNFGVCKRRKEALENL